MSRAEPQRPPEPGEPYCNACGYVLSGLTDSARCPECGTPLVEGLMRGRPHDRPGLRRYRSEATLFGWPVIHVALGPTPTERVGRARGIIAVGDRATGVLAIGGIARGLVALGGVALGGVCLGGISLGLLAAWGGVAVAAIANGGLAVGLLAAGGLAVGLAASGGLAVGWHASGGAAFGPHVVGPGRSDQAAVDVLRSFQWFFGPPGVSVWTMIQPMIAVSAIAFAAALSAGVLAAFGLLRHERRAARAVGLHPGATPRSRAGGRER